MLTVSLVNYSGVASVLKFFSSLHYFTFAVDPSDYLEGMLKKVQTCVMKRISAIDFKLICNM